MQKAGNTESPLKPGDMETIEIIDLGISGDGIGRIGGMAVFVPETIPGDCALVEITQVKKNAARGTLRELTIPSAHRVKDQCPYGSVCGGCSLRKMSYQGQLALKEKWVKDRLIRIGGVMNPLVRPVMGMEQNWQNPGPWRYRNKASFPVGRVSGSDKKKKACNIGFYRLGSNEIIDCQTCLLQTEPAEVAAQVIREYAKEEKLSIYDRKTGTGILRHVVVRTAFGTGEVMVILVTTQQRLPHTDRLVHRLNDAINGLSDRMRSQMKGERGANGQISLTSSIQEECNASRRLHQKESGSSASQTTLMQETSFTAPSLNEQPSFADPTLDEQASFAERILDEEPALARQAASILQEDDDFGYSLESVILNVNKKKTSQNMGAQCITLAGTPTIRDFMCGMEFEISPLSFYQVNPVQTERLYAKVKEFASLTGQETVLDLYCGVGTIGLYLADQAKQVIGIESVKSAVLDANRNATINGIVNARYICGKAEEILPALIEKGGLSGLPENRLCGYLASEGNGTVGFGEAPESESHSGINCDLKSELDVELTGDSENQLCGSLTSDLENQSIRESKDDWKTQSDDRTNDHLESGLDVGFIDDLDAAENRKNHLADHANVVILDPPRSGCERPLLEAVLDVCPKRIVYVSCDPATLARDVKILREGGYEMVEAQPVDMFAFTMGVEVVALLTRKR